MVQPGDSAPEDRGQYASVGAVRNGGGAPVFTLGDDDEAAHLDTTTETVALHSPAELHRPEVRPPV